MGNIFIVALDIAVLAGFVLWGIAYAILLSRGEIKSGKIGSVSKSDIEMIRIDISSTKERLGKLEKDADILKEQMAEVQARITKNQSHDTNQSKVS